MEMSEFPEPAVVSRRAAAAAVAPGPSPATIAARRPRERLAPTGRLSELGRAGAGSHAGHLGPAAALSVHNGSIPRSGDGDQKITPDLQRRDGGSDV